MAIVVVPSSSITISELATRVLQKLGRIDSGETPDTDDKVIVQNVYYSLYDELRDRHLVDWGSADAIPTWAAFHTVDIVANRIANNFGLPRNAEEEEFAIRKMAKHLAADYDYETVEADYF